jgi:hypothetical protein
MSDPNLRNITNHFQDVRLVSLASWQKANEITPRDRGGPYVILQEGYDSRDMRMIAEEFVLGRSGKWLSLGHFFRLPVAERRAEFVFGTAAEVMQMMSELPSKPAMFDQPAEGADAAPAAENDEMAAAFNAAKNKGAKS